MCLLLIAVRCVPGRPLLLLGNRDEFRARASAAAAPWSEDARVIGGRDLVAGGSWLAVRSDGRHAAVTNVRTGLPATAPKSRGWLVRDFGWPVPFYLFGLVGIVWALVWFARVASEPPGVSRSDPKPKIPWMGLLRLPAVWSIIVGHVCHNWTLYLLLAWLPSYFKTTFGVSLLDAGIYSAAPWMTGFLVCNLTGVITDYLLAKGRSATLVRKIMVALGLGGVAIFVLQLPSATSVLGAVVLTCCATGALSISNSGFATNCFDLAPRHSEVIWGISNTFATLPGIFGVYITGWLIDRTGSYAVPFFVTGGITLFGTIFYLLFASGERKFD